MPNLTPLPPAYNLKQVKVGSSDDPTPDSELVDPTRIFNIPPFAPNGDYTSNVTIKSVMLDTSKVPIILGTYDVQLWIYSTTTQIWTSLGYVSGLYTNAAASLSFGTLDPSQVWHGYVQITNINSPGAVGWTNIALILDEPAPTARGTNGAPVAPLSGLTWVKLIADFGANAVQFVSTPPVYPGALIGKNRDASTRWLQLHNTKATPTPGNAPELSIEVPSGGIPIFDQQFFGPPTGANGNYTFNLGLAYAWSSAAGVYTATGVVAANQDIQIWGFEPS